MGQLAIRNGTLISARPVFFTFGGKNHYKTHAMQPKLKKNKYQKQLRRTMEEAGPSTEASNNPTNTQEDQPETQGKSKKKRKRKSWFSHQENQVLIAEVTEHQHQLLVSSTVSLGTKNTIWQSIADKMNAVGEVRRTVGDCKKCWHDAKRLTKLKLAANLKSAMQTGGGSPAPQEELDLLEEQVSAVISEESRRGRHHLLYSSLSHSSLMKKKTMPSSTRTPSNSC